MRAGGAPLGPLVTESLYGTSLYVTKGSGPQRSKASLHRVGGPHYTVIRPATGPCQVTPWAARTRWRAVVHDGRVAR